MNEGACWEGGVIPASDPPSLCSDYASLDPLNIKQNNKQVRRRRGNAWSLAVGPAVRVGLSVGEESMSCGAPAVGFRSSATFTPLGL